MYENLDGSSSDDTKRTDKIHRRFSSEPVDCVSLAYDNKCLQRRLMQRLHLMKEGAGLQTHGM